jgi:IS30 family transposase
MGNLSNFERGQIVCARLAGESVTKISTLLGVSRTTISKVMSAYMNHGRQHQRRGTVGENQH